MKLENKVSDLRTERILIEKKIKALEQSKDPSFWISVIDDIQKGVVTPALSKETQPDSRLNIPQPPNDEQRPPSSVSTEEKNNLANAANSVEPLPFVFVLEKNQSKHWEDLKTRYQEVKSELARIANIYKPQHPARIQLQEELAVLVREMESEVRLLLEKFKAKYKALKLEEQTLTEQINQWRENTLSSFSKVSQINSVKDEEHRLQKLYRLLLQRIEEINVSIDTGTETVLVIEEPRVGLVPLKKQRGILFSFLMGIVFACGAVFLLDYVDDSIKSTDALKQYTGLSSLGIVYSIEWDHKDLPSHRVNLLEADDNALESYRSVRTNLLLSRPGSALKTILITSALPSEGKTTTAVNTATILAQGGLKVLLIDGDLRRPTIHRLFGLKNRDGFSSVLSEVKPFEECVQKTDVENLDLLPAGHIVPDPPKLFHAGNMKEFIDYACSIYDKVVIDSAPVLTVTDSVILSDLADGIIFVIHGGRTSRMAVIKAKEALLDNNSKILGAIVNNLSLKTSGHYYYYGYRYKYRYKYGYGKNTRPDDNTSEGKIV